MADAAASLQSATELFPRRPLPTSISPASRRGQDKRGFSHKGHVSIHVAIRRFKCARVATCLCMLSHVITSCYNMLSHVANMFP